MEVVLEDDAGQLFAGPGEGEIVVRSRYLAHGYAGDPYLTARAFQCDPNESGVRLYRTGWQVSIGDQTIEFAGIEAALRALPEI